MDDCRIADAYRPPDSTDTECHSHPGRGIWLACLFAAQIHAAWREKNDVADGYCLGYMARASHCHGTQLRHGISRRALAGNPDNAMDHVHPWYVPWLGSIACRK